MHKKPTMYALKLKNALEQFGVHVGEETWDGHKHIDLTIQAAKMNIEVDGSHHLTNARQIIRDFEREHYSDDKGFVTIHIPNKSLDDDLDGIASALAEAARMRELAIHGYIKQRK